MVSYEELFKGFIETNNKKSIEKIKGRSDLRTREEVQSFPEYAGVLGEKSMLVDIDDFESSEILLQIVKDLQLNCLVIRTGRGKHFYFLNNGVKNNKVGCSLGIGIKADIKIGTKNSYGVLKMDGQDREVLCTPPEEEIQDLPKWLQPVIGSNVEFLNMETGDGRNQALFNYILTLQSNNFTVEEARETIRIINKYVLKNPLSDRELAVILRDGAFSKPVFYKGKTFLHNTFGDYLRREENIVSINDNLHIYSDGIYVDKTKLIHAAMIKYIPTIKKNQRIETFSYLEAVCEDITFSDINKIPVKNGLFNLETNELEEFTPSYISKNKIVTNYNPTAHSELIDQFLDSIACGDQNIRSVIEEMVGTILYRSSDFDAFFILIGDGSNGKSTLLELIINLIGEENATSIELRDLDKTFKTAELFGKLANIGDDISSTDIKNSSFIKKIASGNKVNVERKGKNPFEMKPYAKMIFSSNTAPIIHDVSHGLNRRLVLIPLNNTFQQDILFKSKIMTPANLEYFLILAIEGLKRVLKNKGQFTSSKAIEDAGEEYQRLNNPVLAFLEDIDEESILNCSTGEVFLRFNVWCSQNNYKYDFHQSKFIAEVKKATGYETKKTRIPKKDLKPGKKDSCRIFCSTL